jgi:ribosomal protein L19
MTEFDGVCHYSGQDDTADSYFVMKKKTSNDVAMERSGKLYAPSFIYPEKEQIVLLREEAVSATKLV